MKSNPYDTLIDLIGEIEQWASLIVKAPNIATYNKIDTKLAKAKSKAFAIIEAIRNK